MQTITRRTLLTGCLAAGVARAASSPHPNLLFIMTDQQTHDAMSCAGNRWLNTPALDALAAAGARFTECYTTYPLCSPARSSIFTGCMPHENGVRMNDLPIGRGISTMGEIFTSAGFETVYAGKWHLPKPFEGMTGFRCLIGGSHLGADMDAPAASACINFLRSRKSSQPFLMVASLMNPHDIGEWIRQHRGRREHADPHRYPPAPPTMGAHVSEPEYMHWHRTQEYGMGSEACRIASEWRAIEFRHFLYAYYRLVEQVDAQIGRILAALRDTGLDRSTLLIFSSDHGESMGAHRLVQKKSFYEESAKVPLIVSGAGVHNRGHVDRNSLVSLLDILPTFCDYAGVTIPRGVRGRSLRPAVDGKPLDREYAVSEVQLRDTEDPKGRMLRTHRYKYCAFNAGANPEQLFDLELDPGEVRNLAPMPEHRDVLVRHRALLAGWVRQTNDNFEVPSISAQGAGLSSPGPASLGAAK